MLSSYVNIVLDYTSSVREFHLCPSNDGFWYIAGHLQQRFVFDYLKLGLCDK